MVDVLLAWVPSIRRPPAGAGYQCLRRGTPWRPVVMVRCKLVLIDTANAESLLPFTQWVLDRMPLREPPLAISIRVGAVRQVPHDFERG